MLKYPLQTENINEVLEEAYAYAIKGRGVGRVASYIPQLSSADPDHLGISITDLEGKITQIGDCEHLFTMQSVSKVILLCAAIEDVGHSDVFEIVGAEPTGDPFDSIIRLENRSKIPLNPMINAGAIAVTSTITGKNPHRRLEKILTLAGKLLGNPDVYYSDEVYRSESATGDRNRAIAYMMKSNEIMGGDVEEHLEVYFKSCAILANCNQLSYMGAVLANNGKSIDGDEQIISAQTARLLRSLMLTCGLYDESGQYAVSVGIPSKSGVGGGIFGTVPKLYGIATYSPQLNDFGNSVCGIRAMEYLSEKLDLNIF